MSRPSNNGDFHDHPALPLSDLFGNFGVMEHIAAESTNSKDADASQKHPQSPHRQLSIDRKSNDDVVGASFKALQSFNASAEQFVRKQKEEEIPLEPFVSNPFLLNVCQLRSFLNQLSDKND